MVVKALRTPLTAVAAVLLLANAALSGCAPSLEQVIPSAHLALGAAPLKSVTLMPIDLVMEAEQPVGVLSDAASARAAERALPRILETTRAQLAARGYGWTELDWDGTMADRRGRQAAIDPTGLANLADWLLGFGYAVMGNTAQADGNQVAPLPFSTDATLYVGGYAHLHKDRPHRTEVAIDVAIGVGVAVLIVGVILLMASSRGRVGWPSFGSSLGGAALKALTFPAVLGAHAALAATRSVIAVSTLPFGHIHGPGCNVYLGVHAGVVYVPGARPRPELGANARRANELALSATLIENRTGRILWTAGQPMAVDPVDEDELHMAVSHLLEKLPRAR